MTADADRTDTAPARRTVGTGEPGGEEPLLIASSTEGEPGRYIAWMPHVDAQGYGLTRAEAVADWERIAIDWFIQYHRAARALAARTRGPE